VFPHAQPNQGMRVAVLFQELHHHHVVIERVCRGDDFEEIAGMLLHLGKSFFQLFCATKIMVGEDQMSGSAQTVEIIWLQLRSRFQLNINEMATQAGRFYQNVNL
jgi:hypothetical protein